MFQIAFDEKSAWLAKLAPELSAEPPIEPRYARRAVNKFLGYNVTMMTLAGDPTLLVGDQTIWRVPVRFAPPDLGPMATIGSIDVDAVSGELFAPTDKEVDQMMKFVNALAANLPPYTNKSP